MKWTRESLLAQVGDLPRIEDDEARWERVWCRHPSEFDLKFKLPEVEVPWSEWHEDLWARMTPKFVRLSNVAYVTQTSVRLDVLYWYMVDPLAKTENFDTDGWMGNDHPVLIELPDGSYAIRDGHHRIISKILSGRQFAYVYVMKGK